MVSGAGREHLDLPPAGGQTVRDLAQHQLGATYDVGSVPRGHKGDAAFAHERDTVVVVGFRLVDG